MLAQQQFGINPLDVAGNASYQNAYTIYMLPYSLIAVSLATAIFPKYPVRSPIIISPKRASISARRCAIWV